MSHTPRFLTAVAVIACSAGVARAQMAGGGMGGPGSSTGRMAGSMSAQMMGGQMMKPEMMSGMAGTMTQMHQIMEKMAGSMGQSMDMKTLASLPDMMDDLAGLMKQMAAQMRGGKMDEAMLKRMNARVAAMGKALEASSKGGAR